MTIKQLKSHIFNAQICRPQLLGKTLPKGKRKNFWMKILNIGCGNSTITEELYDLGYHDITNIDISETCIASMIERNKEKRPNMKF